MKKTSKKKFIKIASTYCSAFMKYTFKCAMHIIQWTVKFKKITLTLLISAAGFLCIQWLSKKLNLLSESSLPNRIVFLGNEPQLQISKEIEKKLKFAIKEQTQRTKFLDSVAAFLELQDDIESFKIRSSLNKVLEIEIKDVRPVLQFVSKSGQLYWVGHNYRIVPGARQLKHIPLVSLPETKVIVFAEKSKPKKYIAQINLPWLQSNIYMMRSKSNIQNTKWLLERMQWTVQKGFQSVYLSPSEAPDSEKKLSVAFGDSLTSEKLERLEYLITELDGRSQIPASIDLNFAQKAIIKLSGTPKETGL